MRTTGLAAKLLISACVALVPPVASTGMAWAQAPTSTTTSTVTTTTVPSPVPPPPSPADTCVKGAWPQIAQGRPLQFKAGDHGFYLWHDPDGGWALRVTHAGPHDKVTFSGTLTTGGQFVDVERVRDESNDIVALSPNKHTIIFRFVNYGWVDGLNFATHCSTGFSTGVRVDGSLAPVSLLHLGAAEVSPLTNPFKIERS
jgi:hypothetical protein